MSLPYTKDQYDDLMQQLYEAQDNAAEAQDWDEYEELICDMQYLEDIGYVQETGNQNENA